MTIVLGPTQLVLLEALKHQLGLTAPQLAEAEQVPISVTRRCLAVLEKNEMVAGVGTGETTRWFITEIGDCERQEAIDRRDRQAAEVERRARTSRKGGYQPSHWNPGVDTGVGERPDVDVAELLGKQKPPER